MSSDPNEHLDVQSESSASQQKDAGPDEKATSKESSLFEQKPATSLDASKIELKAEDLYDKTKIDLEQIPMEDVFKLLQCNENGLSQEEAARRLKLFGPNKL